MTTEAWRVRSYEEADRAAVIELWRNADLVRPWNDPDRDIDRKVAVRDGLLLVAAVGSDRPGDEPPGTAATIPRESPAPLVGTVMVGYEGHRGWVNYLAVDPAHQGRGLGSHLMAEAERRLAALGCPKVNLMVRVTNAEAVAFYRGLGYVVDDVTALGKRLIGDP